MTPDISTDIAVNMIRADLSDIPESPLPRPYSIRWFKPGDDLVWTRIEQRSEARVAITSGLHASQFGSDAALIGRRQCFLCNASGEAIGTATAWFDSDYRGGRWGRVHWVAIVPEARGLGLAKPLLSTVLQRLRTTGHTRAVLSTHSYRLEAISLYLKFGFVPDIQTPAEATAWQALARQLPIHA